MCTMNLGFYMCIKLSCLNLIQSALEYVCKKEIINLM